VAGSLGELRSSLGLVSPSTINTKPPKVLASSPWIFQHQMTVFSSRPCSNAALMVSVIHGV
jgi:hypothetical protein